MFNIISLLVALIVFTATGFIITCKVISDYNSQFDASDEELDKVKYATLAQLKSFNNDLNKIRQ